MLAGTKNLQPIDNPIGTRLSPMSPVRSVTYVSGPDTRLRGGAGRTRTNHQSVMEHGLSPTNSPGRTPMQIAGRFAVLLDFPGFLILESTTRVLWNMVRVRPTTLVGHPSRSSGVCCFPRLSWQLVGLERATRFLRKAVRVRPAHHVGLFISVRLCGNDILLGFSLPLFSGPKIPFPGNREPDCGDPGGRG